MADVGIVNPSVAQAQGNSVTSLLGQYLGVDPTKFGTSSGKGAYGDWTGTITSDQYQALIAAGFNPNAATSGPRRMQSFGQGGGLSINPVYTDNSMDAIVSGQRGPITGYDVAIQSNLAGSNLASQQAIEHQDLGETLTKLAIGGMFGVGLAGLGGFGPLAEVGTTVGGGMPFDTAFLNSLASQGVTEALGTTAGLGAAEYAAAAAPTMAAAEALAAGGGGMSTMIPGASMADVTAATQAALPSTAAATGAGGTSALSSLSNINNILKGGSLLSSLLGGGQQQTAAGGTRNMATPTGGDTSLFGGLAGLLGGYQALTGNTKPDVSVIDQADPFAPYRGQMAQQYANYMTPGATVDPSQMPGYSQWMTGVLNPAMQATTRQMAAQGRGMSGAESLALNQAAQSSYYPFMQNYMSQLAQGAGVGQNPATAVGLGQQASNQQLYNKILGTGAATGGVGSLLNSIFGGGQGNTITSYLQNLFGSGSGGGGSIDPTTGLPSYALDPNIDPTTNLPYYALLSGGGSGGGSSASDAVFGGLESLL